MYLYAAGRAQVQCSLIRLRLNGFLFCEAHSGYRRLERPPMTRGTRPRGKPFYVWCSDAEREAILASAALTRLSASAYLRRVGLGYQPKTALDHDRVMDLHRLRGDLGRLGGLLKLWLTDRAGEGAAVEDVRALLNDIEAIGEEVRDKVRQL